MAPLVTTTVGRRPARLYAAAPGASRTTMAAEASASLRPAKRISSR